MLGQLNLQKYYCAFARLATKKGASRGKNTTNQAQSNKNYMSIYKARVKQLTVVVLLALVSVFSYRGLQNFLDIPVGEVQFLGSTSFDEKTEGATEEELYLMMFESLQAHFWDIDLSALQQLLEEHSWVRKASLRRQWPDKLLVGIDQHVPVARWNNTQLLSMNGLLFDIENIAFFKSLPHFITPQDSVYNQHEIRQIVAQFNGLQKMLKSQRQSIVEMTIDGGRGVSLELDSGISIELGKSQYQQRLQRLIALVDQGWVGNWSNVAVADLRYANGVSVSWAGAAELNAVNGLATRVAL